MLKYENVALKAVEILFKRHQSQNDFSHIANHAAAMWVLRQL